MARAFSPYLPRRAHFTWGVAPGWYRSGLWPLLSLFSDQCANGAPYTTVEQRRTKGRPHVTFDDKRAEGPPYHCSTFPDSCARGRAGSRRDRFSNAPAAARQSFLPPFFCHPFFCHSLFRFFAVPILVWRRRKRSLGRGNAQRTAKEEQRTTVNAQRPTFNPHVGRRVGCPSGWLRPLTGALYPTRRQTRG